MNKFFDFCHHDVIAFDTETTGLHWPVDKAFGFSIATPDGKSTYIDIRHCPASIDWFNDQMSMYKGRVVCHNASFDYKMAHRSGLYLPLERMDDTVIRQCLINEHEMSYSLDALSERYLGDRKINSIYEDLAKKFGGRATRGIQMRNLHRAPPELVAPYAEADASLTLRLWQWQEEEIFSQGVQDIVDFERRVMVPIIKAEMRGIRVDAKKAERAVGELTVVIDEMQAELNGLVGFDLNTNSPKQVRTVFSPSKDDAGNWIADSGQMIPSTDKGQPSLGAEVLREMGNDRRAQLILQVRSTIKTRDTFIAGHVLGHMVGDRVYPNINQTKGEDSGTGTGRLSYTDPALQQIPSRNVKVAAIVKPIFLPDEGQKWTSLDMHSFEVRIFAHLVNNPTIISKYDSNPLSDFHQMVADITGLPRSAKYSGQANAKQLNLSLIFNSGNGAIADKMGMPWSWSSFKTGKMIHNDDGDIVEEVMAYKKAGPEAMAVINDYHHKLPGVKELANKAKAIAESYGYVQTKLGRRLRFPRKYKTYKASGLCIQATAADINKQMWLETSNLDHGHLILNTHDSYEINHPENVDPNHIKKDLQDKIRLAVPWVRVPLVIDLSGSGDNWWDAIKKDK